MKRNTAQAILHANRRRKFFSYYWWKLHRKPLLEIIMTKSRISMFLSDTSFVSIKIWANSLSGKSGEQPIVDYHFLTNRLYIRESNTWLHNGYRRLIIDNIPVNYY